MLAQGNVLLIVDDAKESEVLKRQLTSMDAAVFECADSESAKKAALERDYLCCIIHMKKNLIKGLEICSWIRSESIVPILMITSRDELLKAAGLSDGIGSDHLLDTHLSRARKKIIEAGGPHYIHAVRGVGFRLIENGHK